MLTNIIYNISKLYDILQYFAVHLQFVFQPNNMYVVEEHYYTINEAFLKILGIWPHNKSRLVFYQRMLFMTLAVTGIFLQVIVYTSIQQLLHNL